MTQELFEWYSVVKMGNSSSLNQSQHRVMMRTLTTILITNLLVTWHNGKVMAFDGKDGSILHECQSPDGLSDCAFSKDGKLVVIGSG